VAFKLRVVVIDLEEDAFAVDIEERHIVLAVRVIVGIEVVESSHGCDRSLEEVVASRLYPARDDKLSVDDEAEDWVGARAQRVEFAGDTLLVARPDRSNVSKNRRADPRRCFVQSRRPSWSIARADRHGHALPCSLRFRRRDWQGAVGRSEAADDG
jgi:hypothetical protein